MFPCFPIRGKKNKKYRSESRNSPFEIGFLFNFHIALYNSRDMSNMKDD